MHCPACGSENRAEAKFCQECGTALNAVCPACGAAHRPGQAFCDECGARLAPAPASHAQPAGGEPAPVAERRLVTILFADLVAFTTLSESRDAEEVRELLSRYFETCRKVIALYG